MKIKQLTWGKSVASFIYAEIARAGIGYHHSRKR